jgi:hypothetical protein
MGQVHENEPGVYEIERFQGRLITRHIVETDLDVRASSLTSPRQVNVSRQHATSRAYLFGKPPNDRCTSGSDFPAVPSSCQP